MEVGGGMGGYGGGMEVGGVWGGMEGVWRWGGGMGGGYGGGMEVGGVWGVWSWYGGGMEVVWRGYNHQTDRGEGRTCPNGMCVSLGRAGRVGVGDQGVWRVWMSMEGVWRGYHHQTDRGEGRTCPNGLCVSLGRAGRGGGGEGRGRGGRGYGGDVGGWGGMEGVWRGYGGVGRRRGEVLGYHFDIRNRGPYSSAQYDGQGVYCGLNTASDSEVFPISTTQLYSCLCKYNAIVFIYQQEGIIATGIFPTPNSPL